VALNASQVVLVFTAIAVMLLAAHAMASLFVRFRQPAVVGEIVAGIILGPTLFGLIAAPMAATLFPSTGPLAGMLAGLAELGLLLLMFITGGELHRRVGDGAARTVGIVTCTGLVAPFAVGALVALLLDHQRFSGPNGSRVTFALVFSIAVAVTSIPVISRIMLDLGLLRTSFARVVLSVAVLEDIVLYGVLAVVLSVARAAAGEHYGLWALTGVESTAWSTAYHVAATIGLLAAFLYGGRRLVRRMLDSHANLVERRSPVASRLLVLLLAVLVCAALGVNPIFGALLAGVAVGGAGRSVTRAEQINGDSSAGHGTHNDQPGDAWEMIRQFALAFFIPIYFVTVGLQLDLLSDFDPLFFVWFFLLCCLVKAASIWAGARIAGQPNHRAIDLAIALNARGGPGIILATVTLSAGVINSRFFTVIVLLSVLTSQLAGWWLDRRAAFLRRTDATTYRPTRRRSTDWPSKEPSSRRSDEPTSTQ
jgi:Kef-type K+ transport system membrane component KefB